MSTFGTRIRTLACVACAVALGWAHMLATAAESNRIEAINVASQQGGQILVKITLAQPLANPPLLSLELPRSSYGDMISDKYSSIHK